MFNPGDLEGEVDHSFFDSDHDDDSDGAHKVENDGLKTEEESPSQSIPVINNNSREVDHRDDNSRNPNETDEEYDALSQSLASMGSNIDADSESSFRNNRGRSSVDSPTLPRYDEQLSSSGVSRTEVGSTGFADVSIGHTEESEDTVTDVTDVTSLSSPNISPLHCSGLNSSEEGSFEEQQEEQEEEEVEESVPSSGRSNMHHVEDSYPDADQCFFGSESQLGDELVICCPGVKNRKNYSFSNEEVRLIDIENQRLLQALSELSMKSKQEHAVKKYSRKPPHNSVNRRREQERIERQNLALEKRLKAVKPTTGLQRSKQLADYQRLTRISGGPAYTFRVSTTRRVRSTSQASSVTEESWV